MATDKLVVTSQALPPLSGSVVLPTPPELGSVSLASAEAILAAVTDAGPAVAMLIVRNAGAVAAATRAGGVKARAVCCARVAGAYGRALSSK